MPRPFLRQRSPSAASSDHDALYATSPTSSHHSRVRPRVAELDPERRAQVRKQSRNAARRRRERQRVHEAEVLEAIAAADERHHELLQQRSQLAKQLQVLHDIVRTHARSLLPFALPRQHHRPASPPPISSLGVPNPAPCASPDRRSGVHSQSSQHQVSATATSPRSTSPLILPPALHAASSVDLGLTLPLQHGTALSPLGEDESPLAFLDGGAADIVPTVPTRPCSNKVTSRHQQTPPLIDLDSVRAAGKSAWATATSPISAPSASADFASPALGANKALPVDFAQAWPLGIPADDDIFQPLSKPQRYISSNYSTAALPSHFSLQSTLADLKEQVPPASMDGISDMLLHDTSAALPTTVAPVPNSMALLGEYDACSALMDDVDTQWLNEALSTVDTAAVF